jgi:hypothetical protein
MLRLPLSRAVWSSLGLWLAFTGACSGTFSDDGEDGAGGSGGKPSGGSSHSGGKAHSGGATDGGASPGGEGGVGAETGGTGNSAGGRHNATGGHSSGGQASGGNSSGGALTGGSGAGGPCGNAELDPLEQCDPGLDADLCENTCTFGACDTCRGESCADFGQWLSCDGLEASMQEACETVLSCIRETGCAASGEATDCYCGTRPEDLCFPSVSDTGADGPCRTVIEEVTGLTAPIQIGVVFFDPEGPLGFAMQTAQCEQDLCELECNTGISSGGGGSGGSTGTGGQAGIGGTTGGSASGGAASGGTSSGGAATGGGGNDTGSWEECNACAATACPSQVSDYQQACLGDAPCASYFGCLMDSGCAADSGGTVEDDLRACYCGDLDQSACFSGEVRTSQNGLCISQIEILAGTTAPSAVEPQYFNGLWRLGSINNLMACQREACPTECGFFF